MHLWLRNLKHKITGVLEFQKVNLTPLVLTKEKVILINISKIILELKTDRSL